MEANKQDEVSLKELILQIRAWIVYLRKKWVTIFIIGIIGGMLGILYACMSKPKYTGELTFVLSSQSKPGGLAGLAGQFGIDLGNASDDLFAGDNIIELLKSKRIIKGALFRLLPDNSTTLVNLIIDKTDMQKGWEMKERLKGLFPFPNDVKKLKPLQDSLVNELHSIIIKSLITINKVDKKLSFYKVSTTSGNEIISCYLTKYIADEASKFYIDTKTKTARQNLQMLQHEADSLRNLLSGTITLTASATDRTFNLNPAYQVQRSVAQQGQVNATVLGTAYGEVVKNLELAKITLQKETPLYQAVDLPEMPLKLVKKGKLTHLILGGILSVFFTILFLIARLVYRSMILNEHSKAGRII